jgi:hypothetical protein
MSNTYDDPNGNFYGYTRLVDPEQMEVKKEIITRAEFDMETSQLIIKNKALLAKRPIMKPPADIKLPPNGKFGLGGDFAMYLLKHLPQLHISCEDIGDPGTDTYIIKIIDAEWVLDWKHLSLEEVSLIGKYLKAFGYKWRVYRDNDYNICVSWKLVE